MTVLSAQSIRERCDPYEPVDYGNGNVDYRDNPNVLITPFVERTVHGGRSFGLSHAGYDIRVSKFLDLDGNPYEGSCRMEAGDFLIASSIERIKMPNDLICIVHDKSSWAREGLALQNTVLEPGWEGWITLEFSFHRPRHHITLRTGDPIAQLIFHKLDYPTDSPYKGKYQNQEDMPVEARLEQVLDPIGTTYCSVCREPQFNTPHGLTCKNGHGGALSINKGEDNAQQDSSEAAKEAEWEDPNQADEA